MATTPAYDVDCKSTGWSRLVVTLAPSVAMRNVSYDGADTQIDVLNLHVDKSIQKAILTARMNAKGSRRLIFDAPALDQPSFVPTWPAASVSFSDSGIAYKATLPPYADVDRWVFGPLAIEQAVVVTPLAVLDSKPHALIQICFDVCAFRDGATKFDVTVLNSRDTAAQRAVTLSALTITLGASRVWGPEEHLIYEGQSPIYSGSVGGYLEARVDPPTQMFYDAGLSDVLDLRIEDAVYPPPDASANPGGFWDLTYSMPAPGGRPELGPRTNAAAQYLAHHGQSQWEHVVKQGELAGSWCGALRHADGVTTVRLSDDSHYQPASINGELAYYMLQAAHLPSLVFWPALLTGRRCFFRTAKDWAATIAWRIYDDPAQSTKSYSTVDIPYGRRVGGRLCMLGAEFNAEVRGWGRGLLAFIDAALLTPDREAADKAYFRRLVVENISWLDDYALLPGKGHFGVMFSEFDPGDGQGYGAVHPNFAAIAYWQQMELVASLRHAARAGFPTTFAAMKGIVGSFAKQWDEAPESDYPLIASEYYPRVASVTFVSAGIGAHTPLESWPAMMQANYYGAQDSHDIGGPNAGPPYYYLHYLYLGYEAARFGLPGADKLVAWLKPRAVGQIPSTGAYGYADPSGEIIVVPPPVDPPPVVDPPAPPVTRVLVSTLTATLDQPDTVTPFTFSQPVKDAAPAPQPHIRPSYKETPQPRAVGEEFTMTAIAFNAGAGRATGVRENTGLNPALTVVSHEGGADYDPASGWWEIGTVESNAQKELPMRVKVKE